MKYQYPQPSALKPQPSLPMHLSDPTVYIIAAAMLSGAISFMGACVCTARSVRRANFEGFREGLQYAEKRERDNRPDRI